MRHLNGFVDGFIAPFAFIYRTSGWLDQLGKRIAAWLVA